MDKTAVQYNKISHDTIQGIKKRFVYWRDEENNLIRCANREEGIHWYRNYYYKGHSYFALADFLQMQYRGISATWSFSNAKKIVEGEKNFGKQILDAVQDTKSENHLETQNAALTYMSQSIFEVHSSGYLNKDKDNRTSNPRISPLDITRMGDEK